MARCGLLLMALLSACDGVDSGLGAPDLAAESRDPGAADGAASSDGAPTDATPGDGSLPDARAPDAPAPAVLDLGEQAIGAPFTFTLPHPVPVLFLQAIGAPERLYAFGPVSGPEGPLIGALSEAGPLRATANPGAALALLPDDDAPRGELPAGDYTVTLRADAPTAPLRVEAWPGRPGGALRVEVLLPPAGGRAPEDAAVVAFADALGARLAEALHLHAEVRALRLPAGAPADADLGLATLAPDVAPFGAVAASVRSGDAAAVYLVETLTVDGHPQPGFAVGLPAPVAHPESAAGLALVRANLLDDFPNAVADFALHELGHSLGLFHTTEADGSLSDPLTDTLPCPLACDADGDGVLLASECGSRGRGDPPCQGASDNLMFWTFGGFLDATPGQRAVVARHPLVGPLP